MHPIYCVASEVCQHQVVQVLQHADVEPRQLGLRQVEVPQRGQVLERLGLHLPDVAAVHLEQLELAHAADPRHLGDLQGGNSMELKKCPLVKLKRIPVYRADGEDGPQEMERN